jgi:hypothetical protein
MESTIDEKPYPYSSLHVKEDIDLHVKDDIDVNHKTLPIPVSCAVKVERKVSVIATFPSLCRTEL